MHWDPWEVKDEAELEAYLFFNKLVRQLPRKENGEFDSAQFIDNDVDAFRHAFVSGRFVHEYGSTVANILGIANEVFVLSFFTHATTSSRNMDLWNNAVGRAYGCQTRKAHTLAEALVKALHAGELITDPSDGRKFSTFTSYKPDSGKPVIVLKQNRSGRNEIFFDLATGLTMTRAQFVQAINKGNYPGYRIAMCHGLPTPTSRRDAKIKNNLG